MNGRHKSSSVFRLAFAWVLGAPSVFAQHESAASVGFEVLDCDDLEVDDVRRIVALEIAPGLRLSRGEEASQLKATVTCDVARAHVEVAHGAELPLELDLDFDRVPKASRARLLALTVAELIATREIEHQSAYSPSSIEPPQTAEPSPAPASRTFGWWLAPGMTWLPTSQAALVGGNVGAWAQLGPVVVFGDVEARAGRKHAALSDVRASTFSLLVGLSPSLMSRTVNVTVGPAARFGLAQLSASSQRTDVEGRGLAGLWFGPALAASVKWRFASWLALHSGVEVGHVMQPVHGLDEAARTLFAIDGPWASATMGLGGVH